MTNEESKHFFSILESAGFKPRAGTDFWEWKKGEAPENSKNDKNHSNISDIQQDRQINTEKSSKQLFELRTWNIKLDQRGRFSSQISVVLHSSRFAPLFNKTVSRVWGECVNGEVVENGCGDYWCFVEFTQDDPNILVSQTERQPSAGQVGLAGVRVQLLHPGNNLRCIISDYFFMGKVPSSFVGQLHDAIQSVLGINESQKLLSQSRRPSIYEFHYSLQSAGLGCLFQGRVVRSHLADLGSLLSGEDDSLVISIAQDEGEVHLSIGLPHVRSVNGVRRPSVRLEVLESRECYDVFGEIDRGILRGKLDIARGLCQAQLTEYPGSIYLVRRLALLGVLDPSEPVNQSVLSGASELSQSKLFLSYQCQDAILGGRNRDAIEWLSQLGEQLIEQDVAVDNIASFDLILPELLGDAWVTIDSDISLRCYHRILERKGDNSRILQKMIHVFRSLDDSLSELELLGRLENVETDGGELAKILFRRAELLAGVKRYEEAVELSLAALQYNSKMTAAFLLAADLNGKMNRPEMAIELLDELTRSQSENMTAEQRSEIECKIARIWVDRLDRPDLGILRYEHALENNPDCSDANDALISLYEDMKNYRSLLKCLHIKLRMSEYLPMCQKLWSTFSRAHEILIHEFDAVDQAAELTSMMIEYPEIDLLFVGNFTDYFCDSAAWERLLSRLLGVLKSNEIGIMGEVQLSHSANVNQGEDISRHSKINGHLDSKELYEVHLFLAELQLRVFSDKYEAIRHWDQSQKYGRIPRQKFSKMVGVLIDQLDSGNPSVESIIHRIVAEHVKDCPSEDYPVLNDVLQRHSNLLGADGLHEYLIQSYVYNRDEKPIKRRIRSLFSMGQFDAGMTLMDATIHCHENSIDRTTEGALLQFVKNCLLESQWNGRYKSIEALLHRTIHIKGITPSNLHGAICDLVSLGEPSKVSLRYFFIELIRLGEMPTQPPTEVIDCLAGEFGFLSQYYELLAFSGTNFMEIPELVRKSLAMIDQRLEDNLSISSEDSHLNLLLLLGGIQLLDSSELAKIRDLVGDLKSWQDFSEVLLFQISIRSYVDGMPLRRELASVYENHMEDIEAARIVYESLLQSSDDVVMLLSKISELALQTGNPLDAQNSILNFLADPGAANNLGAYCLAVEQYISNGFDPTHVESYVLEQIRDFDRKGEFHAAATLATCMLRNEYRGSLLWFAKYKGKVELDADADADLRNTPEGGNKSEATTSYWVRGIFEARSVEEVRDYVGLTSVFLQKRTRTYGLPKLLKDAFTMKEEFVCSSLVWGEISFEYGMILFEKSSENQDEEDIHQSLKDAYSVFIQYAKSFSHDTRVLIPLYFLLKQFGAEREVEMNLQILIHKVQREPSLIADFPLTIELLRKDLEKIRAKNSEKLVRQVHQKYDSIPHALSAQSILEEKSTDEHQRSQKSSNMAKIFETDDKVFKHPSLDEIPSIVACKRVNEKKNLGNHHQDLSVFGVWKQASGNNIFGETLNTIDAMPVISGWDGSSAQNSESAQDAVVELELTLLGEGPTNGFSCLGAGNSKNSRDLTERETRIQRMLCGIESRISDVAISDHKVNIEGPSQTAPLAAQIIGKHSGLILPTIAQPSPSEFELEEPTIILLADNIEDDGVENATWDENNSDSERIFLDRSESKSLMMPPVTPVFKVKIGSQSDSSTEKSVEGRGLDQYLQNIVLVDTGELEEQQGLQSGAADVGDPGSASSLTSGEVLHTPGRESESQSVDIHIQEFIEKKKIC